MMSCVTLERDQRISEWKKKQEKCVNLDFIKGEITRLWFCMDFLKIELSSDHNNTGSGSLLPQATALYNNVSVFLCLLQIPYGLPYLGSPGASATCAGLPQILGL